jgi:ParB-like chromosome segregation protein Spo0J
MRRKTRKAVNLTAHHAALALQMLIEDGKIAARDVAAALQRRERMVQELRDKLASLGEDAGRLVRTASRDARKTRQRLTRAQKTARQAQGRYMSAVRSLSKTARAKVKAIRVESGVDAAIRAAQKLAR